MMIYVAGPYTKGGVMQNVRKAVEVANDIRSMGHTPFIPHLTHLWHMLIPHDIDYWYKYDVEWLKACDAVFRLPGESKGADAEETVANELGMPVYKSYAEIPKAEPDDMSRADRLEVMLDRMAGRLADYVVLETPMRELCQEIEKLPASELQTKISVMASETYQMVLAAKTCRGK